MAKSKKPASVEKTLVITSNTAQQQHTIRIPFIVGIGASAGGLEALEQFLKEVPDGSGLAFVVIQHLDPNHKGMLPELLQRITPMPVFQAGNRMKVDPNCVYVIPPNKDLSILHGVLHLLEPTAPRGLRLPIDFFLYALAQDQQESAIGVILSGMGSDGTLGLRAIKEKVGVAIVQEPSSAKFDGMPRSAIDAGLADIVATPKDMPEKIISYIHRLQAADGVEKILEIKAESALEKIIILLRDRTGNDFSHYKKSTLYRRIERRRGIHKIETLDSYVRYLQENPKEVDLLFKELLIGVTSFFRDPEVWDSLKREIIPALLARYPAGKVLRAWVPACSTGEEAYSLAVVFKEVLEQVKPIGRFSLQIFATDLDQDTIDKARQGHYPSNIAVDLSVERLSRFFNEDGNGYRINREIREMVVFAPQNLIMDPPFTRLDILTCRNLLIYLGQELQQKLMPLFHYALNPGGVLLLGNAESVGNFTNLFKPLEGKARLYQRLEIGLSSGIDFPTKRFPALSTSQEEPKATHSQANFQFLTDQFLLQNLAPAAVLVNADGDITYFNGRTGKYLEPAAGKANLNIYAMAREGLRYELASALKTVCRDPGSSVILEGLQVGENGAAQTVNVTVQAIEKPAILRGMVMIAFSDVTVAPSRKMRQSDRGVKQIQELEQAHAEIRAVREEMQISREELTSSNEELQSMNEELQSANEELMTSKEEIQSLNEELQTINAELQSKVEDLSSINSDLKNLLNSTEIATVFLDSALRVRRYTDQMTQIFKLIPGDIGRPLSDIASNLDYQVLQNDAQDVLHTLVFIEKQLPTRGGGWFKVRIMPYRTLENLIDGVVITFTDISAFKSLETELRGKQ